MNERENPNIENSGNPVQSPSSQKPEQSADSIPAIPPVPSVPPVPDVPAAPVQVPPPQPAVTPPGQIAPINSIPPLPPVTPTAPVTSYGAPGQSQPQPSVPPTPPPYGMPPQGAYPPPLPQVIYQPPQERPVPPMNGLAIASMVLGIVSVALICCCCGAMSWMTSLVGLVLGIVACVKGNRTGMTIAGLILNGLALLFTLVLVGAIFLGSEYSYDYLDHNWLEGTYL